MAAITDSVGICNLSLGLLNQDDISSLAGNNSLSQICSKWYDQTREQVLMMHTWNFAIKRIIIAEDTITPEFGWSHRYLLPSDFLRFMSIGASETEGSLSGSGVGDLRLIDDSRRYDYEIENGYILVNEEFSDGLRLRYISNVDQVTLMPSLFKNVFATQLALNMAYEITGTTVDVQRLANLVQEYFRMAIAIDGQERPPRRTEASRFNAARQRLRSSGSTSLNTLLAGIR